MSPVGLHQARWWHQARGLHLRLQEHQLWNAGPSASQEEHIAGGGDRPVVPTAPCQHREEERSIRGKGFGQTSRVQAGIRRGHYRFGTSREGPIEPPRMARTRVYSVSAGCACTLDLDWENVFTT